MKKILFVKQECAGYQYLSRALFKMSLMVFSVYFDWFTVRTIQRQSYHTYLLTHFEYQQLLRIGVKIAIYSASILLTAET